jgi:hypothetical protein
MRWGEVPPHLMRDLCVGWLLWLDVVGCLKQSLLSYSG